MWKCPKCNLMHQNPETHWKHLKEKPDCLKATSNQDNKGWQGHDLDGAPVFIWKPAEDVPRHLWYTPK